MFYQFINKDIPVYKIEKAKKKLKIKLKSLFGNHIKKFFIVNNIRLFIN